MKEHSREICYHCSTNMNKVPRWVFRYVGNKTFDFSSKKRIFCPKTTQFGLKLAFFCPLQAHLVPCWWVGWWLWRGLHLARHLFTLWTDHNAQCAFWVLRWPCGQKLKSKNTLSDGKKIFLRLFFLCCFRKKTLKLVSLFIFRH